MVPPLSRHMSDFTVASTGNVAVPLLEGPMAFRPGGSCQHLSFAAGPFPGNRANHDGTRLLPRVNGSVCAAEIVDE